MRISFLIRALRLLSSLWCVLFLGACGQRGVKLREVTDSSMVFRFDSLLQDKGVKIKDGYYLLIQVDGCSHCVDTSIRFSRHHLNSDRITFILTSEVGGSKVFGSRYTEEELKAHNMVLDGESSFIRKKFCNGLMTLFTVFNGHLKTKTPLYPEEIGGNLGWLQKELR